MWVQIHPCPLISWEALGKQAPTAVWTSLSHPKTRVVSRAALRVSGTLGGSEAPPWTLPHGRHDYGVAVVGGGSTRAGPVGTSRWAAELVMGEYTAPPGRSHVNAGTLRHTART